MTGKDAKVQQSHPNVAGQARARRRLPSWSGGRGQSLVELALIAPVLIVLMLGVIDFGRVYFAHVAVTNAAQNGAAYAAQNAINAADTVGIKAAATGDTGQLLHTSGTNPAVTVTTGNDAQGRLYAEVKVHYTFTTIFPWPGLPNSFSVDRTVRARVQ
jgi:Flp pilus assembly protein TadG